jgi:gluconate 5-dehydrogenase
MARMSAPPPPAQLFDLSGQVALVTGASRGLGWAMARALAAAGALVVLNSRDQAALAQRQAELAGWGLAGDVAAFDVADAAAATASVAAVGARHGRLDILISNAGTTVRKPLLEQTEADWRQVLETDLTASWRLAREAARLMIPAGYGRIVLVGSINGAVARPGITPYVAAKTGLHGLARGLAADLAPHGITVNALAPGYFTTDGNSGLRASDPGFQPRIAGRTPAGRWGEPAELGAAAVYLASRAAGFTTGGVLTVDGGLTAVI